MSIALRCVLALVLATQAFIDLKLSADLPGWALDVPVADAGGVFLILMLPWLLWNRPREVSDLRPLLAASALGVLVLVLTAMVSEEPVSSLKYVLRKPVFFGTAYLLALPLGLQRVPRRSVETGLLIILATVAALSLLTSVGRIVAGQGLWWQSLAGLTPNHKTLGIWLAPFIPWLIVQRHRRGGWMALLTVLIALGLTGAKAAWVTAAFGIAWWLPIGGRPLVTRTRTTLATLATLLALSLAVPVALQNTSVLMAIQGTTPLGLQARMALDATRSRQSLNLRSWEMFVSRPLVGHGPGTSTKVAMVTFPHYRINGVDAHGAIQKVASETGLLGLGAGALWLGALATALRRRWSGRTSDSSWAWLGVAAALHLNLVSSTETWSMTHWIPLGLAWWGVTHHHPRVGFVHEKDR